MNGSRIEAKNLGRRAAVIAWVALSLTWAAAWTPEGSGQTPPASGHLDSASNQAAAGDAINPAKIDRLIAQLGADQFAVREAASNALIKIGDKALDALKKAVESDDPEVAVRAKMAIRAIQAAAVARLPRVVHSEGNPIAVVSRPYRVVDSEGHPIAGTEITFVVRDPQTGEPTATALDKATSDRRGLLSVRLDDVNWWNGFAAISHPQLGRAVIPLPPPSQGVQTLAFPLVPKGTPAYERALKGRVLDQQAKPVAQAMIFCSVIRTPGEGLISADNRGFVLTDDQGQFVIYPIAYKERRKERGKLIPKNSRFHLTVRPSKKSGLFPAAVEAANTQPASIVLERPQHEYTFKAEKPDGTLAGGAELRTVYVTFSKQPRSNQPRQAIVVLDRGLVQEGGRLLPGFYTARMGNLAYLPLEVKDDSPRELVFRLPASRSYRGKIVDGKTGKPLQGAFVIAEAAVGENNLAALTDAEWDSLEKLPSKAPMDLPIIARLRTLYLFHGLVRTDAEGGYEITGPRGGETYALIAFARDRLPYSCRTYERKAGADGKTHVPDLPLYPAAKVLVRPAFEKGHISIGYYWSIEREGQPAWASAMRGPRWPSETGFERLNWLKVNERQPLYVPAGVRLKVMFDTPYDDQWTVINPGDILFLDAGQTKDLGDLKIVPSAKVKVRVTDENGKPVEGVPLRMMKDVQDVQDARDQGWCVAHNTDAAGKAIFYVPAGSSGKIAINDFPQRNAAAAKAANVTVSFRVGKDGRQVAPCAIRVTAEQIQLLLGK